MGKSSDLVPMGTSDSVEMTTKKPAPLIVEKPLKFWSGIRNSKKRRRRRSEIPLKKEKKFFCTKTTPRPVSKVDKEDIANSKTETNAIEFGFKLSNCLSSITS